MVYSMTGYGKSVETKDDQKVTVEVRTVNHRFLDVKINMSHSLFSLENEIRQVIQSYFNRGRVDVYIHLEDRHLARFDVKVDWHLMDQYMEQIDKAKDRYQLAGNTPLELITSLPDLFLIEQREHLLEEIKDILLLNVRQACKEVQAMRQREGMNLKKDMLKRMQTIHNMVLSLEESQPIIVENYSERVKERIHLYIDDSAQIDETRLHQEIALLAEKGDITEEITRLKSHISHSVELLNEQSQIGRKLDFVIQEVHRELNTIGSKAIDEQMSRLIVQAKGELEKIREQIQNIE